MKLHLVDRIVDPASGKTVFKHKNVVRQVAAREEAVAATVEALKTVVTDEGTGHGFARKGRFARTPVPSLVKKPAPELQRPARSSRAANRRDTFCSALKCKACRLCRL